MSTAMNSHKHWNAQRYSIWKTPNRGWPELDLWDWPCQMPPLEKVSAKATSNSEIWDARSDSSMTFMPILPPHCIRTFFTSGNISSMETSSLTCGVLSANLSRTGRWSEVLKTTVISAWLILSIGQRGGIMQTGSHTCILIRQRHENPC